MRLTGQRAPLRTGNATGQHLAVRQRTVLIVLAVQNQGRDVDGGQYLTLVQRTRTAPGPGHRLRVRHLSQPQPLGACLRLSDHRLHFNCSKPVRLGSVAVSRA